MNELQRLNYLEALGIQQWIAKAPLSNAKQSNFVSLSDYEKEAEKASLANTFVETHEQDSIHNSVMETEQEPKLEQRLTGSDVADSNVLDSRVVGNSSSKTNAENTAQTQDLDHLQITSNVEEVPACAFQIQGKRGQYLLFSELQDKQGKMNSTEQNLIHNIAKAIESLSENTSTRAVMPEQFKWPMFESHFKAEHIDQGERAAKEGIRAFLHSSIKKHVAPVVVILGEQAQYFSGIGIASNESEGMIDLNALTNTQFIIGASLSELSMQGNQSLKAELWNKILKYLG